jgi:hypothetical protein
MDNVKYELEGNKVRVSRPNGVTYALTGEQLDYCLSVANRRMGQCPNATLARSRDELREALDVLNVLYATDTQAAWARMGCKGGAM